MLKCVHIVWIGLLALSGTSWAHQSPNAAIDQLSHIMSKSGPTPALLVERAYEYRTIGRLHLAEMDLRFALHKDKEYAPGYVALAKLYMHDTKPERVLDIVQKGHKHAKNEEVKAELHALAAASYMQMGKNKKALESINAALENSPRKLTWILTKSRILKLMREKKQRVATLRVAYAENGVVHLGVELIDALRDAGQYISCLEIINGYIAKRQFKEEWYLRRAEVHQAMGNSTAMMADATLALKESKQRLEATHPSIHLYEDMAKAYALLGDEQGVKEVQTKIESLTMIVGVKP